MTLAAAASRQPPDEGAVGPYVGIVPAIISTAIHNGTHRIVTTVPAGTAVHDSVAVSGGSGTPAGTVLVSHFTNGTCSGGASAISASASLRDGAVDVTGFAIQENVPGSASFRAVYSGDATYRASSGPCEVLAVTKATPVVTTVIHDLAHHVITSVEVGVDFHEFVTVSGPAGTPTGSINIRLFANASCSPPQATAQMVDLDGTGSVDGGLPGNATVTGTISFNADYGGSAIYNPRVGPCSVLTITRGTPTIATEIHDPSHTAVSAVPLGTTIHVSVVVSGAVGTPTGTVTFRQYSSQNCTGSPSAESGVVLLAGALDLLIAVSVSSAPATESWRVTYDGSTIYNPRAGLCRPISWKAGTSISTAIHDAAHMIVTSVPVGSVVHDSAVVSGIFGTPTGLIIIEFYTGGTCSSFAGSGRATLVGGSIDVTGFPHTVETAGTYGFKATYLGDATYLGGSGSCERLTASAAVATTSPGSSATPGATAAATTQPSPSPASSLPASASPLASAGPIGSGAGTPVPGSTAGNPSPAVPPAGDAVPGAGDLASLAIGLLVLAAIGGAFLLGIRRGRRRNPDVGGDAPGGA